MILDPAQETVSGLSRLCVASCSNFLTRDQGLVQTIVGFLSDATMQKIGDCLKTVLAIP